MYWSFEPVWELWVCVCVQGVQIQIVPIICSLTSPRKWASLQSCWMTRGPEHTEQQLYFIRLRWAAGSVYNEKFTSPSSSHTYGIREQKSPGSFTGSWIEQLGFDKYLSIIAPLSHQPASNKNIKNPQTPSPDPKQWNISLACYLVRENVVFIHLERSRRSLLLTPPSLSNVCQCVWLSKPGQYAVTLKTACERSVHSRILHSWFVIIVGTASRVRSGMVVKIGGTVSSGTRQIVKFVLK